MSQKTKSYLIYFLPVFVFVLLAFGVVYAQNYDLVNVGPGPQYKHGGLGVGGYFRTYSGAVLGDVGSFIGIGMADPAAPQASLDIRNARSSGDFRVSNMGGIYVETSDSNISAGIALSSQGIAKGSIYMGHVRVAGHGSQDSKVGDGVIGVRGDSGRLIFATGAKGVAPQPARMIIDEKGNVGIGTTNPQTKLDVWGNLRVTGNIVLNDGVLTSPNLGPNKILISTEGGTVVWQDINQIPIARTGTVSGEISKEITVAENGNIGIGVTNPQRKLHILSDSFEAVRLQRSTAGGGGGSFIEFALSDGKTVGGVGLGLDGSIIFKTPSITDDSLFRILDQGNVGIGTKSPETRLHIVGQVKIEGGNPGEGKVLTSDAKGLASWQSLSSGQGTVGGEGPLSVTSGYKTTGLTGIAGGIHIAGKGSSPNSGQIVWGDNSGWKLNFGTRLNGNFVERVTFTDAGRVGIGINNPTAMLDVAGRINADSISMKGIKLCYYKCYSESGKIYCDTYRTDTGEVVVRKAAYLGFDTAITKDVAHNQLVTCSY